MNIFAKILITTLPLVIALEVLTVSMTIHFSRTALKDLAETWLETKLSEASKIAADQVNSLQRYGLADIPASVQKAKLDAAAAMAAIKIREEGYIVAVGSEGIVAMHTDAARVGEDVSQVDWFKQLEPGQGRLSFTTSDGRCLAMYASFPAWDWYILAVDTEREVYGAINRIKPYIVSLGIVGTAVLTIVLMLFTRRLTSPLKSLTDGADRIGKGALDTRIAIRSHDEFGQLSRVFNQMGSQLQDTLTALQHREEHFRSLIENASDIITILDDQRRILYASPSMERGFGYPPRELIGKSMMDFIHEDERAHIRRLFRWQTMSQDRWGALEFRVRHQDGSWRTVEATSRNLLKHPAVNGVVVNFRDITKRKHAESALHDAYLELERRVAERTSELHEANVQLRQKIDERKQAVEALQASEQRMKAILRASPVGIGLLIDRHVAWANETMLRLLGYEEEALLGQSVAILYRSTEEFKRVGQALYANVQKEEIRQVETQLVRRDGTFFDCMVRALSLDAEDLSKGQIIAVMDISEAKKLEARLQRAKKMEAIGTLAGGVAHDLNNILSGIVSYPELLLLELETDSPLRKPIRTIQKSGERASAIVQDLLTMARRGVAVTEVLNLNMTIAEQLRTPEFKNLKLHHPHVSLSVKLVPDLMNIRGSGPHLSKCLMNLLANAAEAMPEGGQLIVTTANIYLDQAHKGYEHIAEGEYVTLTVQDTGVGIAEVDREHIFEPFYTKKEMGRSGSGLGMAVVWGTVKDHNGFIDFYSKEGQGSTFTLYFPVTREACDQGTGPMPFKLCRGRGETILVVDDSEEQREIAASILAKLDYKAVTAASGEEAVAYLHQKSADLLLLDMIMAPGIDGLETYRRIIEFNPGQKALIVSGFSETARVKAAQALGAGQYVKKPYALETIAIAIQEELQR